MENSKPQVVLSNRKDSARKDDERSDKAGRQLVKSLYARSKELYGSKNYPEALAQIKKAIDESPIDNHQLFYMRALILLKLKRNATSDGQACINTNSNFPGGYSILAQIHCQEKRFSVASKLIEKGFKLSQKLPDDNAVAKWRSNFHDIQNLLPINMQKIVPHINKRQKLSSHDIFTAFPLEIIMTICDFLKMADIIRMRMVCRAWDTKIRSTSWYWEHLLLRGSISTKKACDIVKLSRGKLKSLSISSTSLKGAFFETLIQIEAFHLKELRLHGWNDPYIQLAKFFHRQHSAPSTSKRFSSYHFGLRSMEFGYFAISPECVWKILKELPYLEILTLNSSCDMSGLFHSKNLQFTHLRELTLSCVPLIQADFDKLHESCGSTLRTLTLFDRYPMDLPLYQNIFGGFINLEELHLHGRFCTLSMANISKTLKKLSLDNDFSRVSNFEEFEVFLQNAKLLDTLYLYNVQYRDNWFASVGKHVGHQLKVLHATKNSLLALSPLYFTKFLSQCPNLEVIDLSYNGGSVTDEIVEQISQTHYRLVSLDLSDSVISGSHLISIMKNNSKTLKLIRMVSCHSISNRMFERIAAVAKEPGRRLIMKPSK